MDANYYAHDRQELLALLPSDSHFRKGLEIGCGEGRTGQWLLQHSRADWITGVEAKPDIASSAAKNLNQVLCVSIEREELPFQDSEFDLIILADVLEHLWDPWRVMQRVAGWLAPGGYVLCSIPNVQHWRGLWALLSGKWEYQDHGLLDRTHIRFFSLKTAAKLLEANGLHIVAYRSHKNPIAFWLNVSSCGIFANYLTTQGYYLLKGSSA